MQLIFGPNQVYFTERDMAFTCLFCHAIPRPVAPDPLKGLNALAAGQGVIVFRTVLKQGRVVG